MSVRVAPPPASAAASSAAAASSSAAAASSSAAVAAVYSAPSAEDVAASLAVSRRLRASGHKRLLHSRTPLRDVEDQAGLKRPRVPAIFDSAAATFDLHTKASAASKVKRSYLFTIPFRFSCNATHRQLGTIEQLGTKNPIMYIQFPMGRVKLFGTLVRTPNTYVAIQYPGAGSAKKIAAAAASGAAQQQLQVKGTFENIFTFTEWRWVGRKEDNPEEKELAVPAELHVRPRKQANLAMGGSMPQSSGSGSQDEIAAAIAMDDGEIDLTMDGAAAASAASAAKPARKRVVKPRRIGGGSSEDDDDDAEESPLLDDEDSDAEPTSTPVRKRKSTASAGGSGGGGSGGGKSRKKSRAAASSDDDESEEDLSEHSDADAAEETDFSLPPSQGSVSARPKRASTGKVSYKEKETQEEEEDEDEEEEEDAAEDPASADDGEEPAEEEASVADDDDDGDSDFE